MAKRKRKAPIVTPMDLPTPEQLANGDYERDFVTHVDTNTKTMAFRRRDSCIVEKWCREGGPGFDEGAKRVIADCTLLWMRLGEPRLIAYYGERLPTGRSGGSDDADSRHDALAQLQHYKQALGARMRPFWDVFEMVVRHNEPAGVAGSRFANNDPQRIQSAKVITGMVASFIAARMGY